ncbi:MAG: repeat containing protein [Phycisphaerales bacterium]|nr:repeat containing protein [Phycisphaerales bacterium]
MRLILKFAAFAMLLGLARWGHGSQLRTPIRPDLLDPATFGQWVDGAETAVTTSNGPRHVVWTDRTPPDWDGVRFGESKMSGPRHLRIGFKEPVKLGAVLVRGGGRLSVLKADAAYPGKLDDDSQWTAAQRLVAGRVSDTEVGAEEYAVWVLPPGTGTRALRFTHVAEPTERSYAGWLGGAFVLSERLANIAPEAIAVASADVEKAPKINDGTNNGTWNTWDNGAEGASQVVSAEHPEWVMLVWSKPVPLDGLGALWAGFSAADAQVYTGPAGRHPREAADSDWKTVASPDKLESQYPRALGVNWIGFAQPVTTRAVRLRITHAAVEDHPHLKGNTRGGKRVWLGELLALRSMGDADLAGVGMPVTAAATHPPIPIRFHLDAPGLVTLVIEDTGGRRVRNLVSETPFPAGDNVAWWDAADDLGRDPEAARHGIYHVPGKFVPPGEYRVRGLFRKPIELRYEFPVYTHGDPAWETADTTGGWLANHTPPSAALFVPADRAPVGKPLVFLGSYVTEGGSGLSWVDLSGKKVGGRGWIGGNWTGAPFLARDCGTKPSPGIYAYVGAAWEDELRLTALVADPKKLPESDRPFLNGQDLMVLKPSRKFPAKLKPDEAGLAGLAVRDGLLVASIPVQSTLLFVDVPHHKELGTAHLDSPGGVAFDADGRLLVFSGKRLLRYVLDANNPAVLVEPQVVIAGGLEEPQQIALDDAGNLYITDRGHSHQVKVFSPDGKLLRTIGTAGVPKAGPYDPTRMNNPKGLTIDSEHRLWVTEEDFQPKRVSVWTLDGKWVDAFYGPSEYGGGGKLDPADKTRFYFHGMEFRLDWDKGTSRLVDVLYRPGPDDLKLPDGHAVEGQPQDPIHVQGRRYFTNCFNSNPTGGSPIAMLWLERDGVAFPVAALGRANDWSLLKTAPFRARWPEGVDPAGQHGSNQSLFVWSDLNEDGHVQPEEVTFLKAQTGGVTVMSDLAFVESRVDGRSMRYVPQRFTLAGVPVYDLVAGQVLASDVQGPVSSGGDQALANPDGWTVLTVAPKPFTPQSLCGVFKGEPRWSYPSVWPGLHASHESPAPDRPGELIGTTRLLGSFIAPPGSDAGPLWCVNGNQGNMYLFTDDGLFVATLFHDVREGRSWSMPVARRGMLLNDLTLHDENFWPGITQANDGKVYLVDGGRSSLVRLDGLETIRRLPPTALRLTDDNLAKSQQYVLAQEADRQKLQGQQTLKVAVRSAPPRVDGKLDDWAGASWVTVDRRGVAAFFDSKSKPYDVSAALAVTGDRLYAAFRTGEPELLKNSGAMPNAPFKTGGALDLMIGVDPHAPAGRTEPAAGDLRLLVTTVKGKPMAVLYRPVAPDSKNPVPFSSPWRTIRIDQVQDVSADVQFAATEGDFEFSIPLSVLGLRPEPGQTLRGDVGVLRGDGFQTLQRVYWSNKATGITADVPSEAMLTPNLWGQFQFVAP